MEVPSTATDALKICTATGATKRADPMEKPLCVYQQFVQEYTLEGRQDSD
jgi:hypothetical protein